MEQMNPSLHNKIEATINSIDGLQKAEMPAFFYTRLQAKMQKKLAAQQTAWMPFGRPAWLIATLVLFLVINTVMIKQVTKQQLLNATTETPSLQSFASEFDLNNSTNY